MRQDVIISAERLSHVYRNGPNIKNALLDVSFEIERGATVAIIGVTGSGKTTLIQHFNGLLRPSSGSLIVDGIDVGAKRADLRALRQRVGMLFQFPEAQLFERSVYADVAFGPQRMHVGPNELKVRVEAALQIVGLPHSEFGPRSPFSLSGGEQRRVALAGVLAMTPRILVLDEPTVGLDAAARTDFYNYLRHARQQMGMTIVLVSHDMAEVAALADKILVLHQGRLVLQGEPRQVFTQAESLHHYGLAAPPLQELLALLRERGMAVPVDVLTVDEAVVALRAIKSRAKGEG